MAHERSQRLKSILARPRFADHYFCKDVTCPFPSQGECKTFGSTCMMIHAWTTSSAAHVGRPYIRTPATVESYAVRYDCLHDFVL